jgi:hypothetical protein
MEVLVLDGKQYVKASKAARELGYATDYVGQLCRSGQVDAHLIGRTWYVNQDELGTHRVEKKRMSRVKAREQVKKSIEEHRVKIKSETEKTNKHIDIQYERDTSALIPETRKLNIGIERGHSKKFSTVEPDETEESYENEGEKVVISGELSVVDVTDASTDPDTTILTPSRIRKGSTENEVRDIHAKGVEKFELHKVAEIKQPEVTTFSEKLGLTEEVDEVLEVETVPTEDHGEIRVHPVSVTRTTQGISIMTCVLIVFCVLILTLSTIPMSLRLVYIASPLPLLTQEISFSLSTAIEKISLKI